MVIDRTYKPSEETLKNLSVKGHTIKSLRENWKSFVWMFSGLKTENQESADNAFSRYVQYNACKPNIRV